MSKHFRGHNFDGTTFGMEIDATLARKANSKTFYEDFPVKGLANTVRTFRCIKDLTVASVMGECAWLVIEKKAFEFVQLEEDGPMLRVVYS